MPEVECSEQGVRGGRGGGTLAHLRDHQALQQPRNATRRWGAGDSMIFPIFLFTEQTKFSLKFVLGAPNIEGDDDIKKLNEEAKKTGGSATFASKIRSLFFAAKT